MFLVLLVNSGVILQSMQAANSREIASEFRRLVALTENPESLRLSPAHLNTLTSCSTLSHVCYQSKMIKGNFLSHVSQQAGNQKAKEWVKRIMNLYINNFLTWKCVISLWFQQVINVQIAECFALWTWK